MIKALGQAKAFPLEDLDDEDVLVAKTPSTMLPLGTVAPDFSLVEPGGKSAVTRDQTRGSKGLLVMFLSNHCPYVKHVATVLASISKVFMQKGIGVVAIAANDAEKYPEDGPEKMISEKELRGYSFPYLYDEQQAVAQDYQAACTPDFFLFDAELKLVYRGQMDGSRPGNEVPVTGVDLVTAADALLAGRPVPKEQRPSLGCNIKWKPGNEPAYYP